MDQEDPFNLENVDGLINEFKEEDGLIQEELLMHQQQCEQKAGQFKQSLQDQIQQNKLLQAGIQQQIKALWNELANLIQDNDLKTKKFEELKEELEQTQAKRQQIMEAKVAKLKESIEEVLKMNLDEDIIQQMKDKNLYELNDDIKFYQEKLQNQKQQLNEINKKVVESEEKYLEIYTKTFHLQNEIKENQAYIDQSKEEFGELETIPEKFQKLGQEILRNMNEQKQLDQQRGELLATKEKHSKVIQDNSDILLSQKAKIIVQEIQLFQLFRQKEAYEKDYEQLKYEEEQSQSSYDRIVSDMKNLNTGIKVPRAKPQIDTFLIISMVSLMCAFYVYFIM